MTAPTGADYSLSVDILPDASNFGNRLRAALKGLPAVDVRVDPSTQGFNSRLRTALLALPPVAHNVRVDPSASGFNTRMRAMLRGLPAVDHRVNATPSTTGFNAALRAALSALPTLTTRVDVTPRLTGFNASLRSALTALPAVTANVRIEPSLAGFNTRLRAGLAALSGIPDVRVRIDPNFAGFNARLRTALTALTPTPVVKVRVDPDMTGFNARLRAAVAAMGTIPTIRVRIEPDLSGFGGTIASAGRAGGSAGGAYASTFRSVVAAALRNLPEPEIGVATGPAEQAIRDIRASLQRLGDERVGITISGEQARAEVRRIREDLERLKAISPITVQARADAAAAQLVLDRLEAQLAAVGRDRTTNVRVRTDHSQLNGLQTALLGSTSRIQLLITAGLAIGPAIVPAAAAAAAAIGAIGGAAIAAGAGLGVGILALSGVVGAVKALNDARLDAAKTQATQARQDKTEASGADQVRSAIASLANTRAQAASQARQSANQIADAERSLASAQQEALRTQRDITRAREDAKDALEDLNSSIANNALSIRQANLDLADAKANLDKVMADPTATKRQREEAQLTYDRAKQQIDDLTTRQGRYAEEKATADKRGIEGSEQVVAAQERAKDAQERVADAERSLSEARISAAEQQRQAAFSIAQAQQAVIAAQRSVATSAVAAAATGGAAMDTLREKMANLSPEGRRFAEFIVGLQPQLIGLRQSAEQALPGFQRGLQELLPHLPAVNDFIRRIAISLGDMGEATGRALSSDRLRPFFTYINDTAAGTLRQLGSAIGNVTVALGNLVVGFAPVQRQLVTGLVDMTKRFEEWSRSLDSNNGFQRFVDYAIRQGPIVLRTLGDLGGALVHILEASAPIGEIVLRALSGISAAINAIPTPVLTILLTTMTALRIASLLAVIPLGALSATIATMPGRLIAMTTSLGAARAGIAGFAASLGGPVVLGIAAAIAGMALLSGSTSKVKDNFAALQSGLDSYRDAFKDGLTPAAIDNARALLAQNSALSEFVQRAQAAGISSEEIVRGLNGEAEAREKIQKYLDDQIDALYREREAIPPAMKAERERNEQRINGLQAERRAFLDTSIAQQNANTQAGALADSNERLIGGINLAREALTGTTLSTEGYGKALSALGELGKGSAAGFEAIAGLTSRIAESNLDAAGKAKLFGEALKQIGSASATSGPQFDALSSVFTNIANSSLNASDKVKLLREALEKLYGASISQVEADENVIRTKSDLTNQLGSNSAGFDLNSAKGRENTQQILANRDSLQAALVALREKYLQDLANGVSEDVAREAHRKNTEQILKGIEPTQRSTGAVGELVKTYGSLPDKRTTEVTAPGLDDTINRMVEAHAVQMGLAKSPPWTNDQISAEATYLRNMINGRVGQSAMRKAEGGLIPGWSPNSKADNIPAWLTAREFVQPVSTVDYYGVDLMEALRKRQIPREVLRGYASGGIVKVPQELPIRIANSIKEPVSLEALWAQWKAAQYSNDPGNVGPGPGFPPWPSSPSRQRGDSGVWKSILNMVRTAGIPYNFGNSYRHGDPLWHGCVPLDTLILTRRGWVGVDEVRVGEDETVGYNETTCRAEWTLIVGMHRYADAELWTITDGQWEADVTPGHKWLTRDGLVETRDLTAASKVRVETLLAPDVADAGLADGDRDVAGLRRVAVRRADVFCPTTTLGTWTARQGEEIFLTGNSGRAIDFMGYSLDTMAQFFMNMQGRVLELIHWSTKTGRKYGITRGRIRDFPTQFPLHKNHLHIAMADGGPVPNIGIPNVATNLGASLAQALNIPHLVRDQGGWIPPGLSLVDNRTGDNEWAYNAVQNEALVGAAARGMGGDNDRLSVNVEQMYVTETSPGDIADELFWRLKTR